MNVCNMNVIWTY